MASANPTEFNFEELVTPAELKILGAKEKGIFFTQEVTGEGEKRNSKDKKKICVSNKRLYILNTQGKTPKLDLSLSLLAISGVTSPSPEQVTVAYNADPHSDKTKQVKLEVKSEFCIDSLAAILSPLHSSLGRDTVTRRLKLNLQGDGRQDKLDAIVDENVARVTQGSQSGAVSELYALLCDYLDISFHDEIAWDLENTYQTHTIRTLSLNDFSHFSTRDLVPLIRILEFTPRFEGLHADSIKLCPDSIDAILSISKHCSGLRSLSLRSVPALSHKLVQKLFVQGFAANPRCILDTIDLSDNIIEDKGLEALATSLQAFPVPPKELKLSSAGFSSKGFASLAKNLKQSDANSSLRLLDLSNNHFSSSSSDLQTFLSLLATPNKIQELSLASTNAPFEPLFTALQKGCTSQLTSLDLSGNSKPAVGKSQTKSTAMKQFFQSAVALKQLNLSACKLPSELLMQVLEGLRENKDVSDLHLNLSQNDLSSCLKEVAEMLSEMSCVTSLDISQTGLDSNYRDIILPILKNRSLQNLDLSGNMKRSRSSAAKALEESLSDNDCSLHSLKLKDCRLGDHMNFVLRSLIRNDSLKLLDVSSNQMGPPCFRQLARLINNNCSLESVLYDDNNASVGCISGLAAALENNYTICEMPIPYRDMPRLRKEGDKELETALSKVSGLITRNQSPQKREHALAVIKKRIQLFLAEQQLMLDNKIVQLDEEVQMYDISQLDETLKEVITNANNLAAKAGLVTMLCENLHTAKLESETALKLSEIISNHTHQSIAPEVSEYKQKLVSEMLDKMDFSLTNAVSKEKLEEIRSDISYLQQPSFLTEDLLSVFAGSLASAVNVSNLNLAEQLIGQICELVASELDAMYQQIDKLESEESPKSPDRSTSGGTCRMKLAFSQSMKRHRISYQSFNPQLDLDTQSDDIDEPLVADGEIAGEIQLTVPKFDDTPMLDSEDPTPESSEVATPKSSSMRSKFRGLSKKIKGGSKMVRTASNSSTSSLKAEVENVPDFKVFEDLSSSAGKAPELNLLKSKPRGPIRRPPRREQRDVATDAAPTDIFTEIAATVVPGLDQEPTAPDETADDELVEASESKLSFEPSTIPEEGQEEGAERKPPPPTSPRRIPTGQTTPGAVPGNPGLASVLMAGLGRTKVRASKSQENLLAAAEREELALGQKKSLDFLTTKEMAQPGATKPKPRQRPASVFKPVPPIGTPENAKEGNEELKQPPIATKRHTMEDKPIKRVESKEEAKTDPSEDKLVVKGEANVDEQKGENVAEKKEVNVAEKKEEIGESLPVAKPSNPGVDGEIRKSPSITKKPILPKPKDKPSESRNKETKDVGYDEVKKPPVAPLRPKPMTIKPVRPLPSKAKPKLGAESPEKALIEDKPKLSPESPEKGPVEYKNASDTTEKTEVSPAPSGEEKDKIQETKPASLESSSEREQVTKGDERSSDTSTTSSEAFDDATYKPSDTMKGRSVSASSPQRPPHTFKDRSLTPTKPKRMTFGKYSEEGPEVTSPKAKSPLASHVTSPKRSSPVHPNTTPDEPASAQDSKDISEDPKAKLEPPEDSKESGSWVVISDDEGGKGKKQDSQTDLEAGSTET